MLSSKPHFSNQPIQDYPVNIYFKSTPQSEWSFGSFKQFEHNKNLNFAAAKDTYQSSLRIINSRKQTPNALKSLVGRLLEQDLKEDTHQPHQTPTINISTNSNKEININSTKHIYSEHYIGKRQTSQQQQQAKKRHFHEDDERDDPLNDEESKPEDENEQGMQSSHQSELSSSRRKEVLEQLFDDPNTTSTPTAPINPKEYRQKVYRASLKSLSGNSDFGDLVSLRRMTAAFEPRTICQQLDKMAAKLVLDGDLTCELNIIALKLSASHVVNLMNATVKEVFKNYIQDDQLWSLPSSSVITAQGLSSKARQLFEQVINSGKNDKGALSKWGMNRAISRQREKLYEANEDDHELFQVLDVMAAVVRTCNDSIGSETITGEMTYYRKVAHIFDIILEDTELEQKDGEPMSRVSKEICKANAKTFGENYLMTGRRIDLIIQSLDLELSSNEWKKGGVGSLALKQQAKNIRMNKALISKWLTFPIPADVRPRLATLSMDWIGDSGYMFTVTRHQGVFVAQYYATLEYPTYIANMATFFDTLNALYIWKNHHVSMMNLLLPAVDMRKRQEALANVISSHLPSQDDLFSSPNVLYTPSKRRKSKSHDNDDDENYSTPLTR